MAKSKSITLNEFLNIVKVLRMLYGTTVAERFFLKNIEEFTGYTQEDLRSLLYNHDQDDTIEPPRDQKSEL